MTGFRLDTQVGVLRKRLGKLKTNTQASAFRPELSRFVERTLKDCVAATPVRNEAIITRNQQKQYRNRINYIPSFHTLENPSLIVREDGIGFVYYNDKWYRTDYRMPEPVFAAFTLLNEERNRRMQTSQSDFVKKRLPARFLYQRTWYQIAQSLSLVLSVSAGIISAVSRKNPMKDPPKAYGQWRGGKTVLSVVIFNVFLDLKTKYWKGNGKAILAQAQAKNVARFRKECEDKVKREISAARRTN